MLSSNMSKRNTLANKNLGCDNLDSLKQTLVTLVLGTLQALPNTAAASGYTARGVSAFSKQDWVQ